VKVSRAITGRKKSSADSSHFGGSAICRPSRKFAAIVAWISTP